MNKKYIVMDVDTGCDDSMALMLAKSCPDIEILALTCVFGNNDVDTTTENTLKVAKMLGINARPCRRTDWELPYTVKTALAM